MFCTAQPSSSNRSQHDEHHDDRSAYTGSRSSTHSVAVQELEQPQSVETGSFTDFDAAAGPMAAQMAGQLVIVSAVTSSTGVLTAAQPSPSSHGDSSAAQPSSSTLPDGLPSPTSVEASLTSSVTSFSRCVELTAFLPWTLVLLVACMGSIVNCGNEESKCLQSPEYTEGLLPLSCNMSCFTMLLAACWQMQT